MLIDQNEQNIKYYSNELNEVIREDNKVLNKTIVYAYNAGENINSKKEYDYTPGTLGTVKAKRLYSYDTIWKDKLTNYEQKLTVYPAEKL